jgi:RNA-directed DNA polymerase
MGGGSQPIPNVHWAPVQFVLTVPPIRDRVVQTAALLVLEPIFEADFDEAAYGYRPKRSALDAVRTVHKAIDEGHTEIVDADLSQYLDPSP